MKIDQDLHAYMQAHIQRVLDEHQIRITDIRVDWAKINAMGGKDESIIKAIYITSVKGT